VAVLIEGYSVVVDAASIIDKYPGGWENFKMNVPNRTLCNDGDLVRLGFMHPEDAEDFLQSHVSLGFIYLFNSEAQDVVIVHQITGPTVPCCWIEFCWWHIEGDRNKRVPVCRLTGTEKNLISLPEGWKFEGSLSNNPMGFHPEKDASR
jgi:hypothetical protein